MWARRLLEIALGFLILAFWPARAAAVDVQQFLMPGPLIQGHAKYEQECSRCHEPFHKTAQRTLCLNCHKEIAADLAAGRGFHGRSKNVKSTECRHCHTDHKGRDVDIVRLDREVFDHAVTDFRLEGAHKRVVCIQCHTAKAKYRDAPSTCIACHKAVDPHHGRLGEACADCHGQQTWKRARFDHEATKFPLRGKHRDVSCAICHPSARYQNTPIECVACHRINDVHGGRYGNKCETCHGAEAWTRVAFDHDKTTFPLRGGHQKIRCATCHTNRLYETKLGTVCSSCHRKDDVHRGRYGPKCETCHVVEEWKRIPFDHDKTTFPLRGGHQKVRCATCHTNRVFQTKLGTTCYGCHRNDDEHRGRYGPKCESCHVVEEWKRITFDHDKTTYPLRGAHRKVRCETCHRGPLYQAKLGTTCHGCHAADDVHHGQQGQQCERCHNENGWRAQVFFDHDLTRFPLIGLHAVAPCEQCHLGATYKNAPLDCVACHRKDDKHEQRLGTRCALCHNPNSWGLWRFDHNTQTHFVLDGGHRGLRCESCHTQPVETDVRVSTRCVACHETDDVHRGGFGPFCERCHVTDAFNKLTIKR